MLLLHTATALVTLAQGLEVGFPPETFDIRKDIFDVTGEDNGFKTGVLRLPIHVLPGEQFLINPLNALGMSADCLAVDVPIDGSGEQELTTIAKPQPEMKLVELKEYLELVETLEDLDALEEKERALEFPRKGAFTAIAERREQLQETELGVQDEDGESDFNDAALAPSLD